VFTAFRQAVERAAVTAASAARAALPAGRRHHAAPKTTEPTEPPTMRRFEVDARSSFPYTQPAFHGGEAAALAHLRYFASDRPHRYKATRNGRRRLLQQVLALAGQRRCRRAPPTPTSRPSRRAGRQRRQLLLWFELLWRDYFRFLHLKYGRRLYRAAGLGKQPAPPRPRRLGRWCRGETGEPLVDAAMRELAATGFMSNRLRQLAATSSTTSAATGGPAPRGSRPSSSTTTYSNQGNWLYIAGRGTDPRGGRRFDPIKQAREHDPPAASAAWSQP
jgi:deoxyribodipyrimidine photo-lyase